MTLHEEAHARWLAWYNGDDSQATWPGRDDGESMEHYIVRQDVPAILSRHPAPVPALDREALIACVKEFFETDLEIGVHRTPDELVSDLTDSILALKSPLEARLQAALALHQPFTECRQGHWNCVGDDYCSTCKDGDGDPMRHPCATVKALTMPDAIMALAPAEAQP